MSRLATVKVIAVGSLSLRCVTECYIFRVARVRLMERITLSPSEACQAFEKARPALRLLRFCLFCEGIWRGLFRVVIALTDSWEIFNSRHLCAALDLFGLSRLKTVGAGRMVLGQWMMARRSSTVSRRGVERIGASFDGDALW